MRTPGVHSAIIGLARAALLASGVAAAADSTPVVTWEIDHATIGALVEDHRVPTVHVRIEWPVGTWSRWARENHADDAFEIQLRDPDGDLRRRSDLLAADLGVGMGDRYATLTVSCLREDLDAALDLVRDVLANRSFDREELRRRRKRSEIAWKTAIKNPMFRASQAAAREIHRPRDPRLRTWEGPDDVSTDVEALVRVRDALVRLPGRVIGIGGDLTPEDARRFAEGLLPPVLAPPPAGLEPELPPLIDAGDRPAETTVEMARLTQVYFGYGRDSLTWNDPDYPAFVIADHVLAGHFYSRLYVALRHEGGETYGVRSRSYGDIDPGPYGVATFTRTANAARTAEKLREVLRVFHEQGITEQERLDAIGYRRGRQPFSRQSPTQVLYRWMMERRYGLPAGFFDDVTERAAALSLEEINAFIERFYDPARFTLVRVVPESTGSKGGS